MTTTTTTTTNNYGGGDDNKVFPGDVMKAYRGSKDIDPLILNLGTTWRSVVKFMPRSPYPRGRTPVPTKKES
jgi:hypothetical protein